MLLAYCALRRQVDCHILAYEPDKIAACDKDGVEKHETKLIRLLFRLLRCVCQTQCFDSAPDREVGLKEEQEVKYLDAEHDAEAKTGAKVPLKVLAVRVCASVSHQLTPAYGAPKDRNHKGYDNPYAKLTPGCTIL